MSCNPSNFVVRLPIAIFIHFDFLRWQNVRRKSRLPPHKRIPIKLRVRLACRPAIRESVASYPARQSSSPKWDRLHSCARNCNMAWYRPMVGGRGGWAGSWLYWVRWFQSGLIYAMLLGKSHTIIALQCALFNSRTKDSCGGRKMWHNHIQLNRNDCCIKCNQIYLWWMKT